MGTVLAVYQYGKSGKIEKRIGLTSGIAAAAASALGVMLMKQLPDHTVRVLVMCCIPVAAVFTLRGHGKGQREHLHIARVTMLLALAVGLCVGFYDGLVGPGTGTFLILLFVHIFGLEDVTASGTAKVTNLCSNLAALTSLLLTGDVLWLLGLPAGLCAMVGAQLGSRLTLKKGSPVCPRDDAVRTFPASCQNDYGYVTIKVAMNLEVRLDESTRSFTRGAAYHSRTSGICPCCQHDALRAGNVGRAGHGLAG